MKKIKFGILAGVAVVMAACGGNNFNVTGKIEGANDSTKMVVEVANNGLWLIADSVTPNKNGEIKVSLPAPACPEIYRLRYNNKSIYFPIDSLDNVTINSSVEGFATDFTLGGTALAEEMMAVEKKAMQMHNATPEELKAWKKDLSNQILVNPSSIMAYYIINKYIGNQPLFNPYDKEDIKIIGAVANAYNSFKPNDPRTAYLVALTMQGRKLHEVKAEPTTVEVPEIPIIEIELQDNDGKMQKLSDVAAQGKVVLVNFTVLNDDLSPAFNKILMDVYDKNKSKGLEIYQISYDGNEFQWRQAAKNLPWITVYDGNGLYSAYLSMYNVQSLPSLFVINRKGEIVERITDINKIQPTVAKYL